MNETSHDQTAVVAEIAAEANRQRADFSAAALDEADIVAAFGDLAPAGATGVDGAAMIARLDAVAHVDVDVPTGSNRAALAPVKKVLRQTQAWYLRYVVDQVNAALSLAVRALEDHETRLRSIGGSTDPTEVGIDPSPTPSDVVVRTTTELVGETVGSTTDRHRRVLSAWSGRGEFIGAMVDSGLDAYGVDPVSSNVAGSLRQGLDARNDDPIEHLAGIPAGSLDAVVIGSAIDLMPTAIAGEILDLSRRAVREGGAVVVLADTQPLDPIRFELGNRRPMSTNAWLQLMEARGLPGEVRVSSPDDLTVFVGRR